MESCHTMPDFIYVLAFANVLNNLSYIHYFFSENLGEGMIILKKYFQIRVTFKPLFFLFTF
jgi:hypothetical protein